ncbi:hypothetical protein HaLaN_16295 [Haematococcus lacustris]|uniref:Uncharacterized protein n=1 Tax=Haematococcus lacustris TaxID=44745 RepID=A0A699ZLE1_HAELA|nr:hypothetical protein HaLaN_16295 [Haematococcus lacustris]
MDANVTKFTGSNLWQSEQQHLCYLSSRCRCLSPHTEPKRSQCDKVERHTHPHICPLPRGMHGHLAQMHDCRCYTSNGAPPGTWQGTRVKSCQDGALSHESPMSLGRVTDVLICHKASNKRSRGSSGNLSSASAWGRCAVGLQEDKAEAHGAPPAEGAPSLPASCYCLPFCSSHLPQLPAWPPHAGLHQLCGPRVSSAVNGQQPCESQLHQCRATRHAGWKPLAGQVHHRLVRPAWSQQRD